MLRYAMILNICIKAFFAIFLSANNFHRGRTQLNTLAGSKGKSRPVCLEIEVTVNHNF